MSSRLCSASCFTVTFFAFLRFFYIWHPCLQQIFIGQVNWHLINDSLGSNGATFISFSYSWNISEPCRFLVSFPYLMNAVAVPCVPSYFGNLFLFYISELCRFLIFPYHFSELCRFLIFLSHISEICLFSVFFLFFLNPVVSPLFFLT